MPRLSRLLAAAARRIAADPRVQAKVSEVVEKDIKPKAEQVWKKHKPAVEAKAAEFNERIRKQATRENFEKLADKVRERVRQRSKPE